MGVGEACGAQLSADAVCTGGGCDTASGPATCAPPVAAGGACASGTPYPCAPGTLCIKGVGTAKPCTGL